MEYTTKDSGQREEYSTGMRRDLQVGKPRYDLIDRDFLYDWAQLMRRGAEKYGEENWRLASTKEELIRFKASAFRHFIAWLDGETDEAHHVAIAFNIAAAEMVRKKSSLDINGNSVSEKMEKRQCAKKHAIKANPVTPVARSLV